VAEDDPFAEDELADDGWGDDDSSSSDSTTDSNDNSDSSDGSNSDDNSDDDDDCEFDCPGDNGSELPPDASDNYYDPNSKPSDAEIEMAMRRIFGLFGRDGGRVGDADNGRSDGGSMTNSNFNPSNVGCSDDGCVEREVGTKVNENLLNDNAKGPVGEVGEGLH